MSTTRHTWLISRLMTLLAAMTLVVGLAPSDALAQDEAGLVSDTEFLLPSGGSITWDDSWEVDEEESAFNADIPGYVVSLFQNLEGSGRRRTYDAQFYFFSSLALVTPDAVRDSILERNETSRAEGFQVLDQAEDDDLAYALTRFEGPDGTLWGSFHVVEYSPSRIELYSTEMITRIADYEETLTSAQETIEIEDEAAFAGVDAEDLATSLAEDAGSDSNRNDRSSRVVEDDSETVTETETETETDAETDARSGCAGRLTADETDRETETETETLTETDTETETETARDLRLGPHEIDPEQEELGLVSATEYESPQHGYTVEWGESWTVDGQDDEPLVSDEETENDSLALINEGETAFLTVFGFPTQGDTPEEAVEYFSTTYVEESLSNEAEVLLEDADEERGGVLLCDEVEADADGASIVLIQYFEFVTIDDGDTFVQITLTVPAESFAGALDTVSEEIELDGDAVLTTFNAEDLEDVD